MALDRGSLLALTFCGGLFIEFTRTEFGQQAGLFDGALKAAQGDFEGFVLFNADILQAWLSEPSLQSLTG